MSTEQQDTTYLSEAVQAHVDEEACEHCGAEDRAYCRMKRCELPASYGEIDAEMAAQVAKTGETPEASECARCRKLGRSIGEVEKERDEGIEALAALFVEGFESDFPEGKGIDGESSQLSWITDLAEVIADADYPNVPSLLPDPGVSVAADRLRATFAYWVDRAKPSPDCNPDSSTERKEDR